MPERLKKRIARVKVTLADDKERELLYTLEELYEMNQLRKTSEPDDPRNFARMVWLGLRHEDATLTLEQVTRLIDAPNLDYYRECVAEASYQERPTGAPPAQMINGVARSIGSNSERSDAISSESPRANSGS